VDRKSISIAGSGKVEGGVYDRVKISGSGKVTGDVEAEEFKGAGAVTVEGSLASGSFKVEGRVTARELKVSGAAKCGPIQGGYIRVSGALKAKGDIEADTVRLSGVFKVEGLISADRVEIRLEDHSKARELGGEVIEVRRESSWGGFLSTLGRLFGTHGKGSLEVEAVEGDELDLEWVVAEVVRGRVVRIGPGCRIGRVEYQESLEASPEAEVGEEVMRTGKELKEWARRAIRLGIGLPISLMATTVRATLGALGGAGGLLAGVLAAAIAIPVLALVLAILIPVFALMFLAVGLGLVAAILGAPFRGRSDRRYLRWEHWDHEERGPRGPGKEAQ